MVLKPSRTVIDYTYNLGDCWEHRLTVTDVRTDKPIEDIKQATRARVRNASPERAEQATAAGLSRLPMAFGADVAYIRLPRHPAILTTNLKSALDTAFLRRIRFIVQFPFPDAEQRAEIWRRVFPPKVPTDGLDPLKLAQLSVAGGNIKSAALNAAFLAADAGEPVRMKHLLRAAQSEYAKLEKSLTEAEVAGWV